MNNEIAGLPVATTRSRKPMKSIRERLKGKEGRLRGNLMGKRVDFSARTVITGDPNIELDEVGVPISIAMCLTFPELVTKYNVEQLQALVDAGPRLWPGAKYVTTRDGVRFDLRHCGSAGNVLNLEPGCVVERHLLTGDFVLFNRQPSLHKMSIMGHRVRVMPYSTFRVNLSVTSPYNADFDGDEMNLHLAQTHEARAEIRHLCAVPFQIVSPQSNKPVMGIVQDSLLGVSKLTKRSVFIEQANFMQFMLVLPRWNGRLPTPAVLKPRTLWTGKQLFSLTLQFGISDFAEEALYRDSNSRVRGDNRWFTENDGYVVIQKGELLSGVIDKRCVGCTSGGLVHIIWHQCGVARARDFLSSLQQIVNAWLLTQGFTVGVSDITVNRATRQKVADALAQSERAVSNLIEAVQKGTLEMQPGKGLISSFESRVNAELNNAREASGKIAADALDDANNIIAMVNAGSKGSTINIAQIMACVGQQNVEGKRIPFGFEERTLPHFSRFDFGPDSRGFTGYIQRRLVKALEDVMVRYDYTVRNARGDMIQFFYGEDNVRAEYVEQQVLELMTLSNDELRRRFYHDLKSPNYGQGWLSEEVRNNLKFAVEDATLEEEFEQLRLGKRLLCTEVFPDGETNQYLPVNFQRILHLNSKRLLQQVRVTQPALDWVLSEMRNKYFCSLAQPGEMTLNTFHFAGVGSKNVTLGVPRLRELINVTKKVATPSLTIQLDEYAAHDSVLAKEVQGSIEYCSLERFIEFSQLIYDPNPVETLVPEDVEWVSDYYALSDFDNSLAASLSPWLIRVVLQERLITEGLSCVPAENDAAFFEAEANDEFRDFFCEGREPKLLLTSVDKLLHPQTELFVKELTAIVPNVFFLPRKNRSTRAVLEFATQRGYTDVLVLVQRHKLLHGLYVCHLPGGPTSYFALTSLKLAQDIDDSVRLTSHHPELELSNFHTALGRRLARQFRALFPPAEEHVGRRVVALQNHRDFIFFRHYRYVFVNEGENVRFAEIGPRFTLKLRLFAKGCFDFSKANLEFRSSSKAYATNKDVYL
uniref:DNA-directed RNA polymerase subunit n=1 Tax=Dermatophagoides pteronyssinus TaxID=6956 RepID=A0A6P6Y4J7_DERPT|nr:DNA-directed RNA polymerase II subunit RPB1-like [Dermatophagoides pteronyssinus]